LRSSIPVKRWTYLAGLFDGDGSISLTEHDGSQQKHFFLSFSVNSVDRTTMNWLVQQFGGSYRQQKEWRENMRSGFAWYTQGRAIKDILENLLPYLRLKQSASKTALEYLTVIPFREENPTLRSQYARRISDLNAYYVKTENREAKTLVERPSNLGRDIIPYVAGAIDAEGTFDIPTPTSLSPQIQVSNTDMRLLDFLYNTLGGIVFSTVKKNSEHRDAGLWRFSGGRCQKPEYIAQVKKAKELLLLSLLPYLVTKKKQAIVSLSCLRREKPSEVCFEMMRELNKVGTPTTNTLNTSNDVKIESDLHGDMQHEPMVTSAST
jgi:hypothetical protein